jgi:capsular polysaccharide transport system ATP-binding protein
MRIISPLKTGADLVRKVASAPRPDADRRAIYMRSATKILGRGQYRYFVLDDVSMVFDASHHYVVLGVQGSGKSTLLRLLSGMQKIGRGTIDRRCKVMPPLGAAHAYGDGASGRELCKIFAQLYDAEPREIINYTYAFSGIGEHFDRSTRDVPAIARSRLSIALGYAVPADIYIFDGSIGAGSAEFRDRCRQAFDQRRAAAGTIFATRNLQAAASFGDRGVIIHGAKLHEFNSVEEALYAYSYIEIQPHYGTLRYAEELLASGRPEEARDYLEDSGLVGPEDPAACELYARIASEMGDDPSAKAAALSALSADATLTSPHVLLAHIASRADDHRAAITHAEAYLNQKPEDADMLRLLARACEADGSYRRAAEAWRNLGETSGNALATRLALRCDLRVVRAELDAGSWEAALDHLQNMAHPHDDMAFVDLEVIALRGLRRWGELGRVIRRIKAGDLDRAVTVICQTLLTDETENAIGLLDLLTDEDMAATTSLKPWRRVMVHLEKSARLATREGNDAAAVVLATAAGRVREAQVEASGSAAGDPNP